MTPQPQKRSPLAFPLRTFHWLIVLTFAATYLSGEGERLRALHVMFGFTLLGLIVFRLAWKTLQTRKAPLAWLGGFTARLKTQTQSLGSGSPWQALSHHPLKALTVVLLPLTGLATCVSGVLIYYELAPEWLGEIHELAANTMLTLVALHIGNVLLRSLVLRKNLAGVMFLGSKTSNKSGAPTGGSAGPKNLASFTRSVLQRCASAPRRAVGSLLLLLVLGFWVGYGWNTPGVIQGLSSASRFEHDDDDD